MTSQVVDPSGQASQEARRAVWRGPAWGEVLLSARLIGFTKLVTWTVLCMRLPASGLQVCPRELQICMRVHQYNGTAAMVNHIQEICLVQRHCRCVRGSYRYVRGCISTTALQLWLTIYKKFVSYNGTAGVCESAYRCVRKLRLQFRNTLQVCPRELQICTRVHQYNGTAAMVNHIQEISRTTALQVCPRELQVSMRELQVSMRELQICTRVHQYNGTAAMVNHIQEICLVQRHCRCVGAAGVCKGTSGVHEGATGVLELQVCATALQNVRLEFGKATIRAMVQRAPREGVRGGLQQEAKQRRLVYHHLGRVQQYRRLHHRLRHAVSELFRDLLR
ncbi:uncharacterized protein [Procambarus clarkii]|uniref:uncharacterized protein n=1 Tax=Procambarus clarkii TaxID=6728 RepID=UPI003744913A